MTFEVSTDYRLIRDIMTHPAIWGAIGDDFTPDVAQWSPVTAPNVSYIIARDGEEVLGLWMLVAHSPVMVEVHTCLLPSAGFRRGRIAAQEMAQWIWENTTFLRIMTQCPDYNRAARKFAKAAGMQKYGENLGAFMKNGALCDVLLFGMSRPIEAVGSKGVIQNEAA